MGDWTFRENFPFDGSCYELPEERRLLGEFWNSNEPIWLLTSVWAWTFVRPVFFAGLRSDLSSSSGALQGHGLPRIVVENFLWAWQLPGILANSNSVAEPGLHSPVATTKIRLPGATTYKI